MGRTLLLYMLSLLPLLGFVRPAFAADNEVELGIGGAVIFDSNTDGTSSNAESDVGFQLSPTLRARSDSQTYLVGLFYSPGFTWYVDSPDRDFIRQTLRFDGEYEPSERLGFFLQNQLSYNIDANRVTEVDTGTGTRRRQQPSLRNFLNGGFSRNFTPRLAFNADAAWRLVRNEDNRLSDSDSASGSGDLTYILSPRNTVGGGVSATWQEVRPGAVQAQIIGNNTTGFYQIFGIWNHQLTRWMRFQFAGGPTLIVTDIQGDQQDQTEEWTFFANVALSAEWKEVNGSVLYRRSQGTNSNTSQSQILDLVSANARWEIGPKWALGGRVAWSDRNGVQDRVVLDGTGQPFSFRPYLEQVSAGLTASHRVMKTGTISLTADYLHQLENEPRLNPDNSLREVDFDTDRFRIFLRFDYTLPPLEF